MIHVQHHRGPDSNGFWISSEQLIGLCHNRLSIVDLTKDASQPMHSHDQKYTIVFNGEIYNYLEIKEQLVAIGCQFRTHSDTEVLLEAYRQWGESMLDKLRGMFAFALYNHAERTLFCARDRVGKKPFCYAENEEGFFFASEIPALLSVKSIDRSIDHDALASMLLYNLRHVPDPATIYKGIRRLRAGHAMTVRGGRIERIWRYWQPEAREVKSADDLREILEEAVAIRSVADVPVGALLSGGVDSTAIVALMQQHSGEPIMTYAFGMDQEDEDLRRARKAARLLGTRHKEFYFDPGRQFQVLKSILGCYGEPIMLLPLIHAFELSEAIRDDGVRVVLNGNGADELFYGYTGHIRTARLSRLLNALAWLRPALLKLPHPALSVLMEEPGRRKAAFYRQKARQYWPKVLRDEVVDGLENLVSREMEAWGEVLPCSDFIDESNYLAMLIENAHSLTIASDLPAMMASVEMRSPFLDQEVVSAAMGIHFSRKVKGSKDGSQLKRILRQAVRDLVPKELLNAPKRGFGMSIQEKDVLLGPWRCRADGLFGEFPELGVFDGGKVRSMWINAKEHGSGDWSLLAKLFAIGLWASEVE